MQVKKQVRTGHGTTDWFQIGKGVRQGCLLSPCLFNFYAECIMRNAGLEEAQAGIKMARRHNAKECSNYHTIVLISHTNTVMLKILQAGLQQYMNCELLDVQAGFRKGRGTRYQIVNIHWIIQKARELQKNIYFCFIDYAKAFDCVDYNKLTVENS